MGSRFNVGDVVLYENRLYTVRSIHFLNPQLKSDPYVCGLVPLGDKKPSTEQLMVREGLLKKDSSEASTKAIKVLYGKGKGTDDLK